MSFSHIFTNYPKLDNIDSDLGCNYYQNHHNQAENIPFESSTDYNQVTSDFNSLDNELFAIDKEDEIISRKSKDVTSSGITNNQCDDNNIKVEISYGTMSSFCMKPSNSNSDTYNIGGTDCPNIFSSTTIYNNDASTLSLVPKTSYYEANHLLNCILAYNLRDYYSYIDTSPNSTIINSVTEFITQSCSSEIRTDFTDKLNLPTIDETKKRSDLMECLKTDIQTKLTNLETTFQITEDTQNSLAGSIISYSMGKYAITSLKESVNILNKEKISTLSNECFNANLLGAGLIANRTFNLNDTSSNISLLQAINKMPIRVDELNKLKEYSPKCTGFDTLFEEDINAPLYLSESSPSPVNPSPINDGDNDSGKSVITVEDRRPMCNLNRFTIESGGKKKKKSTTDPNCWTITPSSNMIYFSNNSYTSPLDNDKTTGIANFIDYLNSNYGNSNNQGYITLADIYSDFNSITS